MRLWEVFVEGYGYEGGGEDEHYPAEGDAQDWALGLWYVVGWDDIALAYELGGFWGAERDHRAVIAPGADAGFDSEPGNGVEERDEEYDRSRKPEVCVKSSQECEEECQAPESRFCFEIAGAAGRFFAYVEALGTQFFHCY